MSQRNLIHITQLWQYFILYMTFFNHGGISFQTFLFNINFNSYNILQLNSLNYVVVKIPFVNLTIVNEQMRH